MTTNTPEPISAEAAPSLDYSCLPKDDRAFNVRWGRIAGVTGISVLAVVVVSIFFFGYSL